MAEQLGGLVPTLEGADRAALLKLRRDIHNLRFVSLEKTLPKLQSAVGHETLAALAEVRELAREVGFREEAALEAYQADLIHAADSFETLFNHDAMSKGIQLSGAQLFRNLQEFVTKGNGSMKPSKARVRESSLVNFAYRASLKPSPFGRFTEIGAFPPSFNVGKPKDCLAPDVDSFSAYIGGGSRDQDVSVTTLNRLLINWLLAAIPRLPGGLEWGHLVLNSTLRVGSDSVEFVGVTPGTHSQDRIASEQVLTLRREPVIESILQSMPNRISPAKHVLAALTPVTGGSAAAEKVVHALIGAGVIFFRPNIDDHTPGYAEKLLALLPDDSTPEMSLMREQISQLLLLETHFARAETSYREKLLNAADTAVAKVAELASVSPPPESVLKSPVFEDTPASTPPQTWDKDTVDRSLPSLEGLWNLASALDNGQVKRMGLYNFTSRLLGNNPSIPFLDFFRAYSSLTEQKQLDILLGTGLPQADKYRMQRAEALTKINEGLEYEGSSAYLDPELIDVALQGLQGRVDTDSVTFRTQFGRDVLPGRSSTLIVNGLLTGYGVYFSRFGSFVGGDGNWSLMDAQRDHLRRRFPKLVDLNSVLGFNFNIHPSLTDKVVNYPGAVSDIHDRDILNIGDLDVRLDEESSSVRLWDSKKGEQLNFIPMNFLTPIGVPLLYRLLEAMSPSNRYLWKPLADIFEHGGNRRRGGQEPRLVVGDVVAERRLWSLNASDIPGLQELSREDYPALLNFDAWRLKNGLPRHAFVLSQTEGEREIMAGRGRAVTRDWADFAHMRRASVHKPMYVDFRNPYLLRSFAKSALSRPDLVVEIRECLPSPESYSIDTSETSAEEYFIELYKRS